jgi:translation initiation factor IF-3
MDYGKFKYESALKARESRKNQAQTVIKEIKLRPKIDPHDYGTKKGHVERFLRQGDKVKVTIMFRGREQSRPELGYRLLQRLAGDIEELGFVEAQPKQDGRNMIMVIGPNKRKSEPRTVRAEPRPGGRGQPSGRRAPAPRQSDEAATADGVAPDGVGADRAGTDAAGTDAAGTDAAGTDAAGTDAPGVDGAGSDGVGTGTVGSDGAATGRTAPADDGGVDAPTGT